MNRPTIVTTSGYDVQALRAIYRNVPRLDDDGFEVPLMLKEPRYNIGMIILDIVEIRGSITMVYDFWLNEEFPRFFISVSSFYEITKEMKGSVNMIYKPYYEAIYKTPKSYEGGHADPEYFNLN